MSSILSKRQQARNERILHDLVKSVPGNEKCADCETKNPGWASWSLGIFLCIRCASLHRKLGTHVSKVKSVSMDSWTNEQVDNMRKNGNEKSNAYFNPDPKKHPPPLSQDDTDSNLERHIRAKYEYQTYRRDASAAPRTTTPFSFGISSNNGSSNHNHNHNLSPPSPSSKSGRRPSGGLLGMFRSSSPSNSNAKANQILGTHSAPYTDSRSQSAPVVFPHGMASATPLELYGDQIKSLREMGFTDTSQCLGVLQQTEGRMMDAVEILIRLNKAEDRRPEPPPKNSPAFGLAVHKTGPAGVAQQSSNPFDALDREELPLPPLPAENTGGSAPQMQMSMSSPGKLQQQQQQQQQQLQQQHQQMGMGMGIGMGIGQTGGWNGYTIPLQQQQPQQQMPLYQMNTGTLFTNNPFGLPSPQQPQQQYIPPPQQYSVATGSTAASYNPFMSLQQPQPYPLPHPQQQQQQQQQQANPYQLFQPQHPPPIDKSSILALYNAPQLAPPRSQTQVEVTASSLPPQQQQQQPPTPTATGSNNPFLPATAAAQHQHQHQHRSQESVDFGAWQNGRHSPDAFASLAFGGR